MKLLYRLRSAPLTALSLAPFILALCGAAAPQLVPWAVPALLAACCLFCLLLPGFDVRLQVVPVFAAAYAVAELLCRMLSRGEFAEVVRLVTPWLHGCFLVFFALVCYRANRERLFASVRRGRRPAAENRRRGAVWTMAMAAGTVLLSLAPVWARGLSALWGWLKEAARVVIAFLGSLMAREEPAGGGAAGSGGSGMMPMEAAEPSPLLQLLKKALYALTALALAALLLWAAKTLAVRAWRGIRRVIAQVSAAIRRLSVPVEEDFVDEVESSEAAGLRISALRLRRERLSGLPPREGIRHEYRRLLRRHREWGPGRTARENLPQAAELYERSRYSGLPVTQEDLLEFRRRSGRDTADG